LSLPEDIDGHEGSAGAKSVLAEAFAVGQLHYLKKKACPQERVRDRRDTKGKGGKSIVAKELLRGCACVLRGSKAGVGALG
jgi:hypothetical protein